MAIQKYRSPSREETKNFRSHIVKEARRLQRLGETNQDAVIEELRKRGINIIVDKNGRKIVKTAGCNSFQTTKLDQRSHKE